MLTSDPTFVGEEPNSTAFAFVLMTPFKVKESVAFKSPDPFKFNAELAVM